MSKRRGFTLIELLVVIAIIALLVTILVPSLQKSKKLAQRVVCASNMRSTAVAVNLYGSDRGVIPSGEPNHPAAYAAPQAYCVKPNDPDPTKWSSPGS